MPKVNFREEVVNVALAELLEQVKQDSASVDQRKLFAAYAAKTTLFARMSRVGDTTVLLQLDG